MKCTKETKVVFCERRISSTMMGRACRRRSGQNAQAKAELQGGTAHTSRRHTALTGEGDRHSRRRSEVAVSHRRFGRAAERRSPPAIPLQPTPIVVLLILPVPSDRPMGASRHSSTAVQNNARCVMGHRRSLGDLNQAFRKAVRQTGYFPSQEENIAPHARRASRSLRIWLGRSAAQSSPATQRPISPPRAIWRAECCDKLSSTIMLADSRGISM